MKKCKHLNFEVEEILNAYSYFNQKEQITYILNGIIFQKHGKDRYRILEISNYTEDDIDKLEERGHLYGFYKLKELSENLYDGYFTNRLYLDSLIKTPKKKKIEQLSLFTNSTHNG